MTVEEGLAQMKELLGRGLPPTAMPKVEEVLRQVAEARPKAAAEGKAHRAIRSRLLRPPKAILGFLLPHHLVAWRLDLQDIEQKIARHDVWQGRYEVDEVVLEIPNETDGRKNMVFGIPVRFEVTEGGQ